MKEVVIAEYLRTAQSRSRPYKPEGDWFHKVRSDELLARLLPEVLKRAGVDSESVDDFIVGCACGIGEQFTMGGKTPLYLANLSKDISTKFVDMQCGSAMAALQIGFMEIATGSTDIVLVGGMEHQTRQNDYEDIKNGTIKMHPALFSDEAYRHWDIEFSNNMGLTAEKLFDQTNITREEMDKFAHRSHVLAAKSTEEGWFNGEILPIDAEQADGSVMTVDRDQSIRGETTLEGLADLKPCFKADGVITAGISSPLNAGASAMLLMSKESALEIGLEPMATIRAIGLAGVDPTIMGAGPVPATRKALKNAGLDVSDVDYWEINEAFSIVALNCIKELGIDPDRVNVKGGAMALGHPLGATGIRLVGTLARILKDKNARYGCANACVGGGSGIATIIEKNV